MADSDRAPRRRRWRGGLAFPAAGGLGIGLGLQGLRYRVRSVGLRVWGLGLRVRSVGFWCVGFGCTSAPVGCAAPGVGRWMGWLGWAPLALRRPLLLPGGPASPSPPPAWAPRWMVAVPRAIEGSEPLTGSSRSAIAVAITTAITITSNNCRRMLGRVRPRGIWRRLAYLADGAQDLRGERARALIRRSSRGLRSTHGFQQICCSQCLAGAQAVGDVCPGRSRGRGSALPVPITCRRAQCGQTSFTQPAGLPSEGRNGHWLCQRRKHGRARKAAGHRAAAVGAPARRPRGSTAAPAPRARLARVSRTCRRHVAARQVRAAGCHMADSD